MYCGIQNKGGIKMIMRNMLTRDALLECRPEHLNPNVERDLLTKEQIEKEQAFNKGWNAAIDEWILNLALEPDSEHEITFEEAKEYCDKRNMVMIAREDLYHYSSAIGVDYQTKYKQETDK